MDFYLFLKVRLDVSDPNVNFWSKSATYRKKDCFSLSLLFLCVHLENWSSFIGHHIFYISVRSNLIHFSSTELEIENSLFTAFLFQI